MSAIQSNLSGGRIVGGGVPDQLGSHPTAKCFKQGKDKSFHAGRRKDTSEGGKVGTISK